MASFDLSNKNFDKGNNSKSKIIGIIIVIVCSLIFLTLFTNFVPTIQDFILGVMGIFAYPFFIIAFTIGIALINNKKYIMPIKYIVYICLSIVAILAIVNIIILGKPENVDFWQYLALTYSFKYTAGGLLIGILVAPFLFLLGIAGAIIIFSAMLVVFVALIVDFLNTIKVYGKDYVLKNKKEIQVIDITDTKKSKQKPKKDEKLFLEKNNLNNKENENFDLFSKNNEENNLEAKRKLGLIEGNLDSEKSLKKNPKSLREYLLTPPEIDLTPYTNARLSKNKKNEIDSNLNTLKNENFNSLNNSQYYSSNKNNEFNIQQNNINTETTFASRYDLAQNLTDNPFIDKNKYDNNNEHSNYQQVEKNNEENYDNEERIPYKEFLEKQSQKPKRNFAQLQIEGTEKKKNDNTLKNIYRRPPNYFRPPLDLLENRPVDLDALNEDVVSKRIQLENALETFGINARVIGVVVGPAVTRYELEMPPGISVKKIIAHKDDIALALASRGGLRIEAPIPGKSAVGVEIPNDKIAMVNIRDIVDSREFIDSKSSVTFALGKDINGKVQICNLAKMPHLLVAGATNSGKSIFLNALIISMIYKSSPEDLRFILIDPKRVEFSMYNDLPHLIIPYVITDTEKANNALTWAINEMERRFEIFANERFRNLEEYNNSVEVVSGDKKKIPYIVIVIDEFNDLMSIMKKDIEEKVKRLAQKARAAGIHLVLATQRPSVDVITGTIKTNFPSRITFALTSFADSKTILDQGGAENLLGKGDMLFLPSDANFPKRIQGCFVSNEEVNDVVEFIKENNAKNYDEEVEKLIENPNKNEEPSSFNDVMEQKLDLLSIKCLKFIIENGQASISSLQRRFSIGFNKAGRIIDVLTKKGYVAKPDGMKPREVYLTMEGFEELFGDVDV